MADKALGLAAAAISALVIVGVLTFAGPCVHDDGSAATCVASQQGILGAGVVALVACVASLLVGNGKVKSALFAVAAVAGVFAAFAPGNVFPLCMMATMHCRAVMVPFAQFAGVALAAVSVLAAVRAVRKKA